MFFCLSVPYLPRNGWTDWAEILVISKLKAKHFQEQFTGLPENQLYRFYFQIILVASQLAFSSKSRYFQYKIDRFFPYIFFIQNQKNGAILMFSDFQRKPGPGSGSSPPPKKNLPLTKMDELKKISQNR